MGKGDIKTRKGKIANGTYGVLRPHKKKQPASVGESKNTHKKSG